MVATKNPVKIENATQREKIFNTLTEKVLSKYNKLDKADAELISLRTLESCLLSTSLFKTKEELLYAMNHLRV